MIPIFLFIGLVIRQQPRQVYNKLPNQYFVCKSANRSMFSRLYLAPLATIAPEWSRFIYNRTATLTVATKQNIKKYFLDIKKS